jgi:hypothetical protein
MSISPKLIALYLTIYTACIGTEECGNLCALSGWKAHHWPDGLVIAPSSMLQPRLLTRRVLQVDNSSAFPNDSMIDDCRYHEVSNPAYEEGERSSRELDKFISDVSAEFIIPKSIPRYTFAYIIYLCYFIYVLACCACC